MAVLDVTIPTGYWIQQQKLDAYILSKRVRNLQRARFFNNKVLFYFDFVSFYADKKNYDFNKSNSDFYEFFFVSSLITKRLA